jgi:GntR family transcriptional regulator/MocR family aminotransferase
MSPGDNVGKVRELLLEVELRRGQMRRVLRETLRAAIQDGRLVAGTRLPASRRLAADLGVSRGVVTDLYEQLASEGYLEVAERSAPLVARVLASASAPAEPSWPSWRFDFDPVSPDVSLFPRRAWARAVERSLRRAPDAALDYGDHRGSAALRTALSAYLGRVRGVRVDAGRIIVTQGFTQGLDLLCRMLARRGARTLVMESPSHSGLWPTVRQAGIELAGCAVDGDGMRIDALTGLRADAVVVAPAHQFPTGAVLTADRRAALVDWATTHGGLVIEDDYDAEFRYDRPAIGAVQGLRPEAVAHIGTASKTLAPGVRLGWISAPLDLVDELRDLKSSTDSGSPAVDQLAFADMLTSGEYERHIVRARRAYRRRRDVLIRALQSNLPEAEIRGAAAGMQILLRLPAETDDVGIVDAARSRGINAAALSPLQLMGPPERGLLLGYGRLAEPSIGEAVRALAKVIAAER